MALPQRALLTICMNNSDNPVYNKRASDQNNIRILRTRTKQFKQLFFHFCVHAWPKLVKSLRKAESVKHLKSDHPSNKNGRCLYLL